MRAALTALLALTAAACGGQDVINPGSACPIATGTYATAAFLVSTEGTCPKAKDHSYDHVTFDARGAFSSPTQVFIPCSTHQLGCALTITCTMGATHGTFEGTLNEDASVLSGVATARSPEACKAIVYDVTATRQP